MLINEVADPYKVQNARTSGKTQFATEKKIANFIKKNCSIMLNAYLTSNSFIYRGLKDVKSPYAVAKIRPDRKPMQMGQDDHEFLTTAFTKLGLKVNRQNSIFCSADEEAAGHWTGKGDEPYIIFVRDGWTGLVFKKVKKDYAFYKMQEIANHHVLKGPDGIKAGAAAIKKLEPLQFNTSAALSGIIKEKYMDILIQGTDYIAIRRDEFQRLIWPLLKGKA